MQDAVELNEEFRIKWPRGEMGALPDDCKTRFTNKIYKKKLHIYKRL